MTQDLDFALPLTLEQALNFHFNYPALHRDFMVMAADWRVDPVPGEEDWFEELTADEFEAEGFREDFAEARFQLWLHRSVGVPQTYQPK